MEFNKDTKHFLQEGDYLENSSGKRWYVQTIFHGTVNKNAMSLTVVDNDDHRAIYCTPSSGFYGYKIVKWYTLLSAEEKAERIKTLKFTIGCALQDNLRRSENIDISMARNGYKADTEYIRIVKRNIAETEEHIAKMRAELKELTAE